MNDLNEVERKARMLMTAHGVGSLGFRFSKGTKQIAALHMQRHRSATGPVNLATTITLSRRWALVMPEQDILEVMLHEIAHALTCNATRPHGPEFAAVVRRLGGKATRRCFNPSVNIDGSPRG
jgi:predicted SprT family Zn-dependent metalloprotease